MSMRLEYWPMLIDDSKRRCTRLEVFLLILTIALIGLILGFILIWLTMFNGYVALKHNLVNWNSNDIVSVSTNVAIDSTALHSKYKVCTSRDCAKLASLFLSNLDEKVDPCKNMFEFTCNNYKLGHGDGAFHSTIQDLQARSHQKLKHLLEFLKSSLLTQPVQADIKNNDKTWQKLSKIFYQKCVDEVELAKADYKPMMSLLDRVGGWPLLQEEWAEFNGRWEQQLSRVVNKTGITSILMDLSVGFDPENSSRTIIELDQPKFGFEFGYSYVADEENPAQKIHCERKLGRNVSEVEDEIEEFVELEVGLSRFATDETLRNDPHHTNNRFQLKELKEMFPDLDLSVYIKGVFKSIVPISDNDTIIIREVNYFRGVQKLLKTVSKRTISNYIAWRLVQSYSLFLPQNTRQLLHQYKANLTGDLEQAPRWEDCLSLSIMLLDMPVGRLLVENSDDNEFAQTKVTQIIHYLKAAFEKEINNSEWVGEQAKEQLAKKLHLLNYDIGYPEAIFNESWIRRSWNYNLKQLNEPLLELALQIKRNRTTTELQRHKQPVDKTIWYQSPSQVDALYMPNLNKITIPFAIMQFPFVSRVPNYILFASIGTIISHEISHAFCSHGIVFDPDGNLLKTWLDKDTTNRYKDRAECFVQQYNKATKNQRRSGHFYLSENIADNLSLKFAYQVRSTWCLVKAYSLWEKENEDSEPILPGFQNFTNSQMFFIAYTNNWCSTAFKPNYGDMHAVFPLRANIPLQNFDEFASEFTCTPNSQMNPFQKCAIW
ncbi:hypothetical protein M3Y97_00069000 [Aphelenchoides bicaudatus]|nr:hypothetical protein M3Y97_00069000 [Aphelenchoides bicaudatus]